MTRWILPLAAASALASTPLLGTGCSSSSKSSGTPGDGGGADAPADSPHHADTGAVDTGTGEDGGGVPEGGVAPHGTQLAVSPNLLINGVTSDGYAVYTDTSAMTYNAVSLSG